MKNLIHTLLSAFLLFALIFSCKKEDDSSNSSSSTSEDTYYMTVKKDGVEYDADHSTSVSFNAGVLDYYSITGIRNSGGNIELVLKSPLSTGTFPTGTDDSAPQQVAVEYRESVDKFWNTRTRPATGTITISENTSTNMKGTFSFTGINSIDSTSKVFTEGKFNARKI